MFDLTPETFVVLFKCPRQGLGSPDARTTIDDAADQVAEVWRIFGDIPLRVLRIADSLNTDDVTEDALAVIAKRMEKRDAA